MSAAARSGIDKVPFLRTSNVLWDEIDLTAVDEMSISTGELTDKSLRPGDLLVCEGGEIGRAAIWNGERPIMSFQNHLHRLRPLRADIDPHFYVYFLQSGFTQLGLFEGAGNKTTIPNLSRNKLSALDVPIPAHSEQVKIALLLGTVRRAMKVNNDALAAATKLKEKAMRELFTRGLGGEAQKETEIGQIPESWRLEPIAAHHTVVSGGTPSRGNPAYWTDGTIPWVKTTEVKYRVISETVEHITQAGLEASAAKLLPPGTLLVAMYGQGVTRGKVAILGIEAACNQACAAINASDESVDGQFLYYFLSSQYDAIRQLAHGGQQQNLNLEIVRDFKIAYPIDKGEQTEIAETLKAIDCKIELHQQKRVVLEKLFKSLLRKLMTGEIEVDQLDLSALKVA